MSGRAASMIAFGRFNDYFSGGVAEAHGVLEGTDTFLGGQISRGGADGHSMDVIAVYMKVFYQLSW